MVIFHHKKILKIFTVCSDILWINTYCFLDGEYLTYTRHEPIGVCGQIIPVSRNKTVQQMLQTLDKICQTLNCNLFILHMCFVVVSVILHENFLLLVLLQFRHVYVFWPTVEFPIDDVCMEDCSCSVLWEHCSHQTCWTDPIISPAHGCTHQRGTSIITVAPAMI